MTTAVFIAWLLATSALGVDAAQTAAIAPPFHETNPLLGRQPSDLKVAGYFGGIALANTAFLVFTPRTEAWQGTKIGVEAGILISESIAIGHNTSIGIKVRF